MLMDIPDEYITYYADMFQQEGGCLDDGTREQLHVLNLDTGPVLTPPVRNHSRATSASSIDSILAGANWGVKEDEPMTEKDIARILAGISFFGFTPDGDQGCAERECGDTNEDKEDGYDGDLDE